MSAANDRKAKCRRLFEECKRRVIELSDRCLAEKWSAEDAEKLEHLAQAYVDLVAMAGAADVPESEMQPVWEKTYAVPDRIPSEQFPDSAATCAICALTADNVEESTSWFAKAISKDETCWFAAASLGEIYQEAKNWKAACGYFEQAVRHAVDCVKPDLYFSLALCNDKARDYVAAAEAYRACLALDGKYPYANNNLGYVLMKARRYEESEAALREAIRQGVDGTTPRWNLVRLLRKLRRYREAIDILMQIGASGRPSKSVEREIRELQGLIEREENGTAPIQDDMQDDSDVEVQEGSLDARTTASDPAADVPPGAFAASSVQQGAVPYPYLAAIGPRTRHQFHREEILEEIIEKQIERHQCAFDRNLRMYDKRDEQGRRWYGRQFAIPDVGRIDLLAEEVDTGNMIVIELKRDQGDREVVAQISDYMTWVREHFGMTQE